MYANFDPGSKFRHFRVKRVVYSQGCNNEALHLHLKTVKTWLFTGRARCSRCYGDPSELECT
jgi:hypothetical protein